MRRLSATFLLVWLPCARAFGFTVAAGSVECFQESVKPSDHVAGEWRMSRLVKDEAAHDTEGAAHKSHGLPTLNVWVKSPDGSEVYSAKGEAHGSFDYYATAEGTYEFCFQNKDGPTKEVVSKIHVGEPPDLIQLAKTEHLTPIEERIKNLHESMNAVRDLQDQLAAQDEQHHKMTRSTRSWLLYFTVLEAIVLVAVSLWQILYLRSFFEVKRVV